MKYNPDIHHRRSIRLPGYDYSQPGQYFVSICVQDRECLFGEISDNKMVLNACGGIVKGEWLSLSRRFPTIHLDAWVVMPNHFHGVLATQSKRNEDSPTLGNVIRAFKSRSAIAVNRQLGRNGRPVWQRNYFERIIRNSDELDRIRRYIHENPIRWIDDPDNPSNLKSD